MRQGLIGGMARSICLSHGELAYRQTGDAALPALVLIHGWGGSSRYLEPLMSDLSDTFCCYAPDLPGFGDSPRFKHDVAEYETALERHSHRGLARVMAEFLDGVGAGQCDLIGHSYGAGVAIALSAMQPARVNKVVLSNFSTFRDERERKMIVFMHNVTGMMTKMRNLKFAHSDGFARMLGGRFFHRVPSDVQLLRDGLKDFWRMDPQASELTVKGSLGWETPNDLRSLPQPVLLIHSRQDQIMPPRNAEYTIGLAPRGQIAWIDDCGHFPMVERRDEFVRIVRDFLHRGDAEGTES
jgi:pimeloyl-ACP methyl ester carboxylesterase